MARAVAAPVIMRAAGADPVCETSWDLALADYRAARQRHEVYLAKVLDPMLRSAVASGAGVNSRIAQLEAKGDALCSARHDALAALVNVPAPCWDSLGQKFGLAYAEFLQFDDSTGVLRTMLGDMGRLSSQYHACRTSSSCGSTPSTTDSFSIVSSVAE